MTPEIYRFRFEPGACMKEVHESLLLSIFAAEGLHGRSCIRLDVSFCADDDKRALVVDARTEAGHTVARIFTNFLIRQFGEEAFRIERVGRQREDALVAEARK